MQMYGNKVKLLDVELPGFKFQPGLKKWEFMNQKSREEVQNIDAARAAGEENLDSYFNTFEHFTEVPDELVKQGTHMKIIRETMFASNYDESILNELSKCLRVLPHHQNTSGFFITIIQKVEEFDNIELKEKEPKTDGTGELPLEIQKLTPLKAFQFIRGDDSDADIQYLKAYFGLTDAFPTAQLVAADQHMKKIYFISK